MRCRHLLSLVRWASKLSLLLQLSWSSLAQAQVPNLTYSDPLIITEGGTYTGNYRSNNSAVPVIQIRTREAVVLQNCTLVGPGDLIYAPVDHTDLTVRECRGYGATPTADNTVRGVFLYLHRGLNLVVEHNYLEGNQGMVLDRWTGNGSAGQTVKIRYNRAVNLDGSCRNNSQRGTACFALLNTVTNVGNIEIAWNQVVNAPNQSTVSDNLNFYDSGGTGASAARVHDNYVQGAYPLPATSATFNGTGMTTDGEGTTAATSTGFLEIDHNQFVSTCNGGINIASGHDVNVHDNRVVTSGFLPDGTRLNRLWCGINPSNYYSSPAAAFGANIRIVDNTVGYACWGPALPYTNRFDLDPTYASVVSGNVHLPNPLSVQTEQNEWSLWLQKLQQNNVTPGLSGSTTPTAPAAPANATFYRAFSLNGGAQSLDGNAWESGTAPGLQVSGGTGFANQGVPLTPATDAGRANMIRSSVYGTQVQLTVANVPAGAYQVYLYVWEDNAPETFSVRVNGQVAQANYSSGAAGHWDRLGPFAATASAGTLTVATSGGTANCSGLEIWRAAAAPTTATDGTATFYRAINLHGGALSLDGNAWEGSAAANYTVNGSGFGNQGQALSPATDAPRAAMLRECQYSANLAFALTAVPAGTYQVYAYVWEDNNPETFSLSVEGAQVASNLSTGAAGSWAKLGPYTTTVSDGTLQLTTTGGTVNLSGVEVWAQAPAGRHAAAATSLGASVALPGSPNLYPNPLVGSQAQVLVEATLAEADDVQVQVLNSVGVQVARATLSFPAGTSSQPLAVGDLPAGPYVVRFASGALAGTALNLLKKD